MSRPLARPEAGRGAPLPRPSAFRPLPGTRPARRVPLGASLREDAEDVLVALPEQALDAASAAAALPDPEELAPGALVVVLGEPTGAGSVAGRLLSALGKTKAVPRAVRCTALLVRGYVEVGAGTCPATGADLAWGRATTR